MFIQVPLSEAAEALKITKLAGESRTKFRARLKAAMPSSQYTVAVNTVVSSKTAKEELELRQQIQLAVITFARSLRMFPEDGEHLDIFCTRMINIAQKMSCRGNIAATTFLEKNKEIFEKKVERFEKITTRRPWAGK